MSQQPPPYGYSPPGYGPQPGYPPQPGYAPPFDYWAYYASTPQALLAPARRAGWCLIGVGVVALLFGTCAGATFGAFGDNQIGQFLDQARQQQPTNAALNSVTPREIRYAMIGVGVAVGLYGIVGVALGLLARGGRLGWLIAGVIFCALSLLYLAFSLLMGAIGNANPAAGLAGGVCVFGLPTAALVAATIYLSKAMRNAPLLAAARQQTAYAAYYSTQQPPPQPPSA